MLNPIHLKTLQTVLRCGSFADAARQLGYTGSAVSQQMSALERQVRLPLFDRDAHGIRATPAARFLAERSRETLGHLRALEDDVALLAEGTVGRLRVGSFPTASERLLPTALSLFRTTHPQVEIHLDEGEQNELSPMLEARELDIALMYLYGLAPARFPRGFRMERILIEDLILLSPVDHPLLGACSTTRIDLLRDETWITTRPQTAGASMLRRICGAAGFEPIIAYRSNNYPTIHGLVAAGLGLAVVPALGHQATPGVSRTRLETDNAFREVMVVRSPSTADGPWRALTQALRQAAEELATSAYGISLPAR